MPRPKGKKKITPKKGALIASGKLAGKRHADIARGSRLDSPQR